mgnify:CR=1 FL=1
MHLHLAKRSRATFSASKLSFSGRHRKVRQLFREFFVAANDTVVFTVLKFGMSLKKKLFSIGS